MTVLTPPTAKDKRPPTTSVPVMIQTLQVMFDQFGLLKRYQKKYGDIFYTPKSSSFPPFAILGDPKGVEQILTADPSYFEINQQTTAPVRVLLGDYSLVLLDGAEHKRQRKLLMPPFHGERMKSYGQTIVDVTKKVISQWQVGETICIRDYTQEISLRVILRAVFGLDEGDKCDRLRTIIVDWLDIFNSPIKSCFLFFPFLQKDLGNWTPWGKFIRQKKLIYQILDSEIELRQNNPETLGEDILSLMVSARDEENQPMSTREIRDELITMLFAGHETTASILAWEFYWLHYHPEIGEKLRTELSSLADKTDYSAILNLPYLGAVVSETLRMNPVVALISRHLTKPFELMGYTFEAGTSLLPSIYLVHQREDIYPEPTKFKPGRFLARKFAPHEYLPFGGGNRRCLGYAFALFEMKLVLTTILSQVEFELLDNRPLKSVRRGLTFSPDGGVRMKIQRV